MTKNYQIKIFSEKGDVLSCQLGEECVDNMFDMFVVNKDSFFDFKIEKILKIEIETGLIIKEFNRLLTLKKEGK